MKPETRSIDLPGKKVVEIGAYKGKSTICIALGLLKNKYKYKFKSIDPLYQDKNTKLISKTIKKFKVENIVETQHKFSETAFKEWDSNFLLVCYGLMVITNMTLYQKILNYGQNI